MSAHSDAAATGDLREDLFRFGLQRSQADIYLALLTKGPQSDQGLLRLRVTAAEEVSSAIETLKLILLVGEQRFRNKTRFYAANPKIAWRWQEFKFVWDRVKTLIPVERVPTFDDARANQRLALIQAIRQKAVSLYRMDPHTSVETGRGRHYPTRDEYALACAEAISLAEQSIVSLDKPPYFTASLPVSWAAITDRRAAGIPYTRCVSIFELFYHGLDIVHRDIKEVGINLRILPAKAIRKKFYLIDAKYLLLKHDQQEIQPALASLTRERGKIDRYRRYADKAIAVSLPAGEFIEDLRACVRRTADEVEERYSSSAHAALLLDLASMGKFTEVSPDRRAIARQLLTDGYLQAVDTDRFSLMPSLDPRFASFL